MAERLHRTCPHLLMYFRTSLDFLYYQIQQRWHLNPFTPSCFLGTNDKKRSQPVQYPCIFFQMFLICSWLDSRMQNTGTQDRLCLETMKQENIHPISWLPWQERNRGDTLFCQFKACLHPPFLLSFLSPSPPVQPVIYTFHMYCALLVSPCSTCWGHSRQKDQRGICPLWNFTLKTLSYLLE